MLVLLVDGDILLVQTPLVCPDICVVDDECVRSNICFRFVRLLGGILKHCGLYVFSVFARNG